MTSGELFKALAARRDDLRLLLDLSRAQLQLIESDEFDELWQVQRQKRQIVSRIESPTSNDSLKDAWRRTRDALEPGDRKRCEAMIQEAEDALQSVMQEDAVASTLLEERLQETQSQLLSIAQAGRGRQIYQSAHRAQSGQLMDLET